MRGKEHQTLSFQTFHWKYRMLKLFHFLKSDPKIKKDIIILLLLLLKGEGGPFRRRKTGFNE